MSIEEDVIQLIEDNSLFFTEEKIMPSTTFYELEIDSLDRLELTMALEDKFDVVITDDDFLQWQRVSDVINFIGRHKHE
jgi:acyl carrier protein